MKKEAKTAKRSKVDAMMEETRAVGAYVKGAEADLQLAGFMAIFHPNYGEERTRKIVNEARERDRRNGR